MDVVVPTTKDFCRISSAWSKKKKKMKLYMPKQTKQIVPETIDNSDTDRVIITEKHSSNSY